MQAPVQTASMFNHEGKRVVIVSGTVSDKGTKKPLQKAASFDPSPERLFLSPSSVTFMEQALVEIGEAQSITDVLGRCQACLLARPLPRLASTNHKRFLPRIPTNSPDKFKHDRFSLEVKAASKHQLKVNHERAIKVMEKKLTVLDKSLRVAIHLECTPAPDSPEIVRTKPILVKFGEEEVSDYFEYEQPDGSDPISPGGEDLYGWTSPEAATTQKHHTAPHKTPAYPKQCHTTRQIPPISQK